MHLTLVPNSSTFNGRSLFSQPFGGEEERGGRGYREGELFKKGEYWIAVRIARIPFMAHRIGSYTGGTIEKLKHLRISSNRRALLIDGTPKNHMQNDLRCSIVASGCVLKGLQVWRILGWVWAVKAEPCCTTGSNCWFFWCFELGWYFWTWRRSGWGDFARWRWKRGNYGHCGLYWKVERPPPTVESPQTAFKK